jgi:hypothetical protein
MGTRVELLPGFKFTGKMVKTIKFTGKIGKNGKKCRRILINIKLPIFSN